MVLIDNCLSDKLMVLSYFRIILIMAICCVGMMLQGHFACKCLKQFLNSCHFPVYLLPKLFGWSA